jgi:hypothetical protein
MYAGVIALNMLEGMWDASFADGDVAYATQAIAGAVASSILAVIWSIYLWRSRTVKRVFVYPLAEKDEPLEIAESVEGRTCPRLRHYPTLETFGG